ncbi:serine/threonine protein kinase [Aliikangiella marina]|uniref:Stress response kinase A n=1 Tax=Aliikangiella marina TaxID=1712262 RepID=A0A545TD50_9GAMM|nr:serine/threonine protein kinase [Aliikangiella marina]TQV75147.1 serine/threonine protein kinase [Aliikangiella marina]
MIEDHAKDFYQLTPDEVLDALESVDLEPQAALLALNSYENRVYQFRDYQEQKYVVKFYRPHRWSDQQILEEHEFSLQLAESEIPVVAPLQIGGETLFKFDNFRFAVFENKGGRTPNLDDEDTLIWLGRFIGRIHMLGEASAYQSRPTLTWENFARDSVDYLIRENFIPAHIQESYQTTANLIVEYCSAAFENFGPLNLLRLHGDCHPSNVMWTDDGPHFVDFDDSRMGPAVQDLWMLVTETENRHQWNLLLEGYEDFREFDDRELTLVEPLRAMRMLHYSAWLARRWTDPSFQFNFPWFNTTRYWEEQVLALKEQQALLQPKHFI